MESRTRSGTSSFHQQTCDRFGQSFFHCKEINKCALISSSTSNDNNNYHEEGEDVEEAETFVRDVDEGEVTEERNSIEELLVLETMD
jgi:hypothetical protein